MSKRFLEFPPMEIGEVELGQKDRAVLLEQIGSGLSALGTLKYLLDKEMPLQKSAVKSALSITESVIAKSSSLTGMQLETEAEVERRHSKIRELNMRIRELEAEVGAGASAEMLTQGVRVLGKKLKFWWEREGLGHIPMGKLTLSEYGVLAVTLSCNISHRSRRHKKDTEWLEWLTSLGFELTSESHAGRDHSILDCDKSRQALRALILKTFPTALIVRTLSDSVYGTEDMGLADVEIIIYELGEAWVLPDLVEEPDE